jgi:quinol monooxygenase YgiN
MSKVAAVAKLTAKPGERDLLAKALQGALDNAHTEPGTLVYALHTDAKEADVLWMCELYESQAALDAHMNGEVFKGLGPVIGPHLGGRPELHFITPIGGKGV